MLHEGFYIYECDIIRWMPQVRKVRFYSRRSGKFAFEIGAQAYREEENEQDERYKDDKIECVYDIKQGV